MASEPAQLYEALSRAGDEQDVLTVFDKILNHPHIYSFSQYVNHPSLAQLAEKNPEVKRTAELFQFGNVKTYLSHKEAFPSLNDNHLSKLRFLTLLSLTGKAKLLPHSLVMEELAITDKQLFEDILIEAICTGLIKGRIDEKEQLLRVDFAESRDLQLEDLKPLIEKLNAWSSNCERTLNQVMIEMRKADKSKVDAKNAAESLAQKIQDAKKNMKSTEVRNARMFPGIRSGMDEDDVQMPTPIRPEKKHKGRKTRDEI